MEIVEIKTSECVPNISVSSALPSVNRSGLFQIREDMLAERLVISARIINVFNLLI